MATNYPNALDNGTSLPDPSATNDTNSPSLSSGQTNQNDALIAIETLVGTNASQTTPAAQYNVLQATSSSASEWAKITSNNVSGSTGSGNFVLATSPTIATATLSSPTISTPTISGTLGNIATGTVTSSGLITANGGITVANSSTLTVSSGSTISFPSGSVSSSSLTNPYKFRAWASGGQALSTTFSTVEFNNSSFDTGSNYSTSTYKFTAPIAGFYWFRARVDMVTAGNIIILGLFVNGSGSSTERGPAVTASATDVQGLLKLSAGDYVTVGGYSSNAANITTSSDSSLTVFEGFLVSAT